MDSARLRIAGFLPRSHANGPGSRAVVWTRGCSLACPGCFNPHTHPFTGGELVAVDELFDKIAGSADIEGVTVSGGEPLQQRQALQLLLIRLRRDTRLSTLVFTGFTWDEVQRLPDAGALLAAIDVLVAGRDDDRQRLARGLRGSANKTVHLLRGRYGAGELDAVPASEVIIGADGAIEITGIDPLPW
jgi:anaerobic ribonucleoside-triphosphate reductase activating protein